MVAFEKQPLLDLQKKLAADLGCELFLLINLQRASTFCYAPLTGSPFSQKAPSAKAQTATTAMVAGSMDAKRLPNFPMAEVTAEITSLMTSSMVSPSGCSSYFKVVGVELL